MTSSGGKIISKKDKYGGHMVMDLSRGSIEFYEGNIPRYVRVGRWFKRKWKAVLSRGRSR